MFITSLCAPAIIYIGFSLIQIIIDIYKGVFSKAFIKFVVMIVLSTIINILCNLGYTVIAWFLVFIPIIMMTIISTLLLRVFGVDPNEKDLRSKLEFGDRDISDNYLAGSDLLNQQKYAYFYDRFNSVERIDRDKIRNEFYDDIEKHYDLSSNKEDLFDLSNNPLKYNAIERILNELGENHFINYMLKFFNLGTSTTRSSGGGILPYPKQNVDIYDNEPIYTKIKPEYEVRLDKMKGNDTKSYEDRYDSNYLLDGYLKYEKEKYDSVRSELQQLNPDVTDVTIKKEIQRRWDVLNYNEQKNWDTKKEEDDNKNVYDPDNFSRYHSRASAINRKGKKVSKNQPCPVNETVQAFKIRTGLDCYEICAPGRERNSAGICVRPCPDGKERKVINGDCEII